MKLIVDEVQENKQLWQKFSSKYQIELPQEKPICKFELIKKGKIQKNKRFFYLYPDKLLFFKGKEKMQFKGILHFSYDVKIDWIFSKQTKKNQNNQKQIIGIKFMKFNQVSCLYDVVQSGNQKIEFCNINDKNLKLIQSLISTNNCSMSQQSQHNIQLELNNLTIDNLQQKQIQTPSVIQILKPFFVSRLSQINFHENFKAIRKIGKGNFASVYMAEKILTGERFAVKAFSKEIVYNQEKGKLSIINELNLMRSVDHQNLVHLHEVYETENSIYMVLDLLSGGSLLEKIKSNHKFTKEEIISIIKGISYAIQHLHKNNIMHRDLKPENIIFKNGTLTEDDICVIDLGLASFLNVSEYLFVRCGTPGFVAPEIINMQDKKGKYDEKCDIFSIGIIFHFLLFGKSPFSGTTYNQVLGQNKQCNFKFDSDPMYKGLTIQEKSLLEGMLKVDPKARLSEDQILEHEYLKKPEFIDCDINLEEIQEDPSNFSSLFYQNMSKNKNRFNMRNINLLCPEYKQIQQQEQILCTTPKSLQAMDHQVFYSMASNSTFNQQNKSYKSVNFSFHKQQSNHSHYFSYQNTLNDKENDQSKKQIPEFNNSFQDLIITNQEEDAKVNVEQTGIHHQDLEIKSRRKQFAEENQEQVDDQEIKSQKGTFPNQMSSFQDYQEQDQLDTEKQQTFKIADFQNMDIQSIGTKL